MVPSSRQTSNNRHPLRLWITNPSNNLFRRTLKHHLPSLPSLFICFDRRSRSNLLPTRELTFRPWHCHFNQLSSWMSVILITQFYFHRKNKREKWISRMKELNSWPTNGLTTVLPTRLSAYYKVGHYGYIVKSSKWLIQQIVNVCWYNFVPSNQNWTEEGSVQ